MIKVGDRFKTNKGGWCRVVKYTTADEIYVQFEDEYATIVKACYSALNDGCVKNPCAALIFGKGFFGQGRYKAKLGSSREDAKPTKAYLAWVNMLSRCYDPNYICRSIYDGVTVTKGWLNYQSFAEWFENETQFNSDKSLTYALDKEILSHSDGKLVYSEATCCLIPMEINNTIKSSPFGSKLQGVLKSGTKYRVATTYGDGDARYDTELEAHERYLTLKMNKVRLLAEKHRNNISPKVFNALKFVDYRYLYSKIYKENPNDVFNNLKQITF